MKIIVLLLLINIVYTLDVYRFETHIANKNVKYTYCDKSNETYCSSSETCCPTGLKPPNNYKCCRYTNGNCCENGNKCCPENYVCMTDKGICLPNLLSLNFKQTKLYQNRKAKKFILFKNITIKNQNTCSDNKTKCDEDETCCILKSGYFACCPISNAVCCNDHLHCCPQGTTCDLSAGTCVNSKGNVLSKLLKKKLEQTRTSVGLGVVCPNGQSQCGSGETCCAMSDGSYGCCPAPNAVCCSDHMHCCPQGTTCDLSAGTCVNSKGNVLSKLLKKKSVKTRASVGLGVVCPDGQSQCGSGETCCAMSDRSYGCCPYNSVCKLNNCYDKFGFLIKFP